MKKNVLLGLLILSVSIFAQSPINKLSTHLEAKIKEGNAGKYLVWVTFSDKGNSLQSYYLNPKTVVSEKSLERRKKVFSKNNLIDFSDLPVNSEYITTVTGKGFELKNISKWFNSISGFADLQTLKTIEQMPFVSTIDVVAQLPKEKQIQVEENVVPTINQPENNNLFDYGSSITQLTQINVPALHNLGYNGAGVTICVMDAGFSNLPHPAFSTMNIIAKWDFVNHDPGVGDSTDMGEGSHGTQTLSAIGGFLNGQLIGPAYASTYILAKTENTDSETPIEEDNWIAAMEWADSIGVDVTSTSLGYITFDSPYTSYTWQNMNGNYCKITIAADLAVKKGICVVNSAGNEGSNSSHNTLGAPADGDSVISIGAVTSSGTRSYFSSVGPTVDGRIKPDVMAMGSSVVVASPYSTGITSNSGTSFSCPLAAGVVALLLDVNPSLTPMKIREALIKTSSKANTPDNQYGYGIINALNAANYWPLPVELVSFNYQVTGNAVSLTWKTASEKNNNGFEIERAVENDKPVFEKIGFVKGNGTTTEISNYSFIDRPEAGNFIYRIKQIDYDGTSAFSENLYVGVNAVESYELYQNYPNPFNPTTNIRFNVPVDGNVKVELFNVLGSKVLDVLDQNMKAGMHSVELNGSSLNSGVYFVKMISGNYSKTIKITLMK